MNFWQRLRRAVTTALLVVGVLSTTIAYWLADAPATPQTTSRTCCL